MRNKIATFCGDEDCVWCPELFVDNEAGVNKAVILTDDFGGEVHMSKAKFRETKRHITTLCGSLSCDFCPEIFVDEKQVVEKQIVITDDFGSIIHMSKDQFLAFVTQAKEGKLEI